MIKIAVICGGPSLERGISLNSARSIIDHLPNQFIEVVPIYVDTERNFYKIAPAQLYSNTPADFDFKLDHMAKKLDKNTLKMVFKEIDLAFPVIHGPFGEDGELQALLENLGVPFIGSDSNSCEKLFRKHIAFEILRTNGFMTLPTLVLEKGQTDHEQRMKAFFSQHKLTRAIVKPSSGGSSIGVSSVSTPQEALEKTKSLILREVDTHVIVEPFCNGSEFTVAVLQNGAGDPVALIPTEIETSYENHEIFDFRKKYLPTNNTAYHTPPRYQDPIIHRIRSEAQKLFTLFGMRDFVRMDGWVMADGKIYFTDFNSLCGLEQNSFFFRQSAIIGLSHTQALQYVVQNACLRYGIPFPMNEDKTSSEKHPVYVLFGGRNAERQVSLMSGTNVWLKLMKSTKFTASPILYDGQGHTWKLPYSYTLNHTVEEILANCLHAEQSALKTEHFDSAIQHQLGLPRSMQPLPEKMSLDEFLSNTQKEEAFVFIAMHGGEGEDGTLQAKLEKINVLHNGSGAVSSALCMDKFATGQAIREYNHPDIHSLIKRSIYIPETANYTSQQYVELWNEITGELRSHRLIIKPRSDGCSAGIVFLQNAQDFERYCGFVHKKARYLPPFSFANQNVPIEMPTDTDITSILEAFIETDVITISKNELQHIPREGWVELTVGVLEQNGNYHALNPSITVAEGAVLSLEEKFQGGTGVNITPPPEQIISKEATRKIRKLIELTAQCLGIQNYARIDIFYNCNTEKIVVIEANSLPGLTPSTVIYHQALAENPPQPPLAFLEQIILSKLSEKKLLIL